MDRDELIELIQLEGKSIYGFCHMLTGNKADADDLYQETFLKAVEYRHKLDASRNPKAYLLAVAIALHKNHRRKFAWRQRIAPTTEWDEMAAASGSLANEDTTSDAVLSLELRAMLQRAAHRLNDKLKVPLYLYYTAGLTVEEISQLLNIPQGTVKSRLHKARVTMRNVLEVDAP